MSRKVASQTLLASTIAGSEVVWHGHLAADTITSDSYENRIQNARGLQIRCHKLHTSEHGQSSDASMQLPPILCIIVKWFKGCFAYTIYFSAFRC